MEDSKNWLDVEKYLDQKEHELLAKEGVILPPDHKKGYKYTPKVKIVQKLPWEVCPVPMCPPQSNSQNWIHKDVNFEIGQGIAYLTLNRPDTNNALTDSVMLAIHDAVSELHSRIGDIRVLVLRAEGKMFSAGQLPSAFSDAAALSDADNRKAVATHMKFLYYFQCLPQFTIALVQGSAMGSAIGLLAVCDMVCAVKAARFAVNEVKLCSAPASYTSFVAQKVGVSNAMRILCMCENLTADKMKELGFVNEVVGEAAEFSEIVIEVCENLTATAPNATARSKRLVQNVARSPFTEAVIDYTGMELATIRVDKEAVAGMVAIQARVKPYWAETPIKPLY
jgi:enoyl-CoA hydratase/carnithine racemase